MSMTEPEFVISRTFDAPRNKVFKAWTAPEQMAKWFGPKGVTIGQSKMDLRPGGSYHYSMAMPDGSAMWGKFLYREIIVPEKLVFVNFFSDEQGNVTRHPFAAHWPLQMLSVITFEEADGKTTLTVRWTPLEPTDDERQAFIDGMSGMKQGWTGTMEQLEAFLA